jgi:hypothetical protein
MILLTDAEIALRLRCTEAKVRRLRHEGRLPSIGGRPVLTREIDLVFYVEEERDKRAWARKRHAAGKAGLSLPEWSGTEAEAARQRRRDGAALLDDRMT